MINIGLGLGLPFKARSALLPSLSLGFTNTNTLDPRITFTRASSGTHFDSTGRLVTDGNNVARFDYDPAVAAGVTGGELVTNGDFSNGTTGWTVFAGGTLTVVGGAGYYDSDGLSNNCAYQTFTTEVGKRYTVSCTVGPSTNGLLRIGTGTGSSFFSIATVSMVNGVPISTTFTATSTTTYLSFGYGNASSFATIDNISVQEVTFTPRGLLIEEQRTNLLLHSRDMTQAAWSKTDVTAARTQVGIDGVASSACLMTEGAVLNASLIQSGAAVTAGSTVTASVVLKRGNNDWIRVQTTETTGADGAAVWFNLNTGAKGTTAALGAGTLGAGTITSLGGGWYRCAVTTLPNGVYTVPRLFVSSASADNSATRVSGATYIVDCAQLEVGAFATSPIITGAATATRAADIASMTGTNFSSWFNATQGTFVAEYDSSATVNARTMALGPTSAGAYLAMAAVNGSQTGWHSSGVSAIGYTVGATIKRAIAFNNTGNFDACTNGGAVQTSAASDYTGTGTTALYLGANASGNHLNGHLRSLRFYSSRLPNTTLQALTA